MSNETTYLGTKLAPDEYRRFSIAAAEKGLSRSALLSELARNFIATSAKTATRSPRRTKKVRAA